MNILGNKKSFLVLAGANGSGKSTIAEGFLETETFDYINADDIAKEMNPSDISKVRISAGKEFNRRINNNFEAGISFAIETTLSGNTYIDTFKKAKCLGYSIILVYTFVDNPQVCIERIKTRVQNGGHFIPDEDVIRRYFRSKKKFWDIYKDMSDVWFIYYNGNENYILVAQKELEKDIAILNESLYTLFKETED
ncbi:MAG: zeta toxin family protein [Endomicrobiaceae bacterium]|jgi:predicted ABC-type ATPase|nr:zeta toxin family protein [Endomicrobiaceae bacterium]